jgi:hypothetical protein
MKKYIILNLFSCSLLYCAQNMPQRLREHLKQTTEQEIRQTAAKLARTQKKTEAAKEALNTRHKSETSKWNDINIIASGTAAIFCVVAPLAICSIGNKDWQVKTLGIMAGTSAAQLIYDNSELLKTKCAQWLGKEVEPASNFEKCVHACVLGTVAGAAAGTVRSYAGNNAKSTVMTGLALAVCYAFMPYKIFKYIQDNKIKPLETRLQEDLDCEDMKVKLLETKLKHREELAVLCGNSGLAASSAQPSK